jgi:hypothetical protein
VDVSEVKQDDQMAVPALGHGLVVTRSEPLEGTSLVWVEGVDLLDQMDGLAATRWFLVDVGAEPA